MINQLFLLRGSCIFETVFEEPILAFSGYVEVDWCMDADNESEFEGAIGELRLLVNERYQPDKLFPKGSEESFGGSGIVDVAELQSSYEMVAGTN